MGLRKVDGEQRIKSNMCQLSHQNDDDVDGDYDDNDDDDDKIVREIGLRTGAA